MNPNDIMEIYNAFPRHVARRTALLSIERALRRIQNGETGPKLDYERAVFELLQATCLYARPPAGQRGHHTPHPTTWFNQSRYLDDPKEWQELTKEEYEEQKRRREANVGVWRG